MLVKENVDFWRLKVDVFALPISSSLNKKNNLIMGTGRASQLVYMYPFFPKDVEITTDKLGFFGWKYVDYSKERYFIRVDIKIGLFQIKNNWFDLPNIRLIYKSSVLLEEYLRSNSDYIVALDGLSMISHVTPRSYIIRELKYLPDNLLLCF